MSGIERRSHLEPGSGELSGLVKVVARSSVRVGAWAAVTGLSAGRRAVDVVRHPEHAAELAADLRSAATAVTKALSGEDLDGHPWGIGGAHVARPTGEAPPSVHTVTPPGPAPEDPLDPLHRAGQELLRRSRDVWSEDRGHPAYARIIEELAPDEGRILMLLVQQGPQPSVDVRTGGFIGLASSALVAPGLNMIGARAGCRYVERVPSYLHNLERLGLIWFSREMLRDPQEYQVLEAQPDVQEACHSVRRARLVRRSIHLTPFGEDFCRDALGLHLSRDERLVVPPHATPGDE